MSHDDDPNYDVSRYDSAAERDTGPPVYSAAKRRKIRRAFERSDPGFSPYRLATGQQATAGPTPAPPAQLFGPLWHEGELAILFAPASCGKSILAVQIADQIARSSKSGRADFFRAAPFRTPHSTLRSQKVLYFDFERTQAQFTERYSAPHPLPGKLPVRYRFSPKFIRADLDPPFEVPERFRKDPHGYFLHWLADAVEQTGARVVVLDNLAYLARTLAGRTGISLVKSFKFWAAEYGVSILAVMHAKPVRGSSFPTPPSEFRTPQSEGSPSSFRTPHSALRNPVSLADLAGAPAIADLADSVFALAPSILAPDLRYIKHLRSRREVEDHDRSQVIVCQLTREREQPASRNSSFIIPNSSFPHLKFLGYSDESCHLDPGPQKSKPQLPKPKWKLSTVEMLLTRDYWRYLER